MKMVAISTLIGMTQIFKTDNGQRLFTDNHPTNFDMGNRVFIYDGDGNTVATFHCDMLFPVCKSNRGEYLEIKDLWNTLKLYPIIETHLTFN